MGVTFSYFTDSSSKLNTVGFAEAGKVNVAVIEDEGPSGSDKNYEGPNSNGGNTNEYTTITADGQSASKSVRIKNVNREDYQTGDTWVRVRVVPVLRYNADQGDKAGQIVADADILAASGISNPNSLITLAGGEGGWIEKISDATTYYYYTKTLAPDELTTYLFKTVTFTKAAPAGTHYEVEVLTEGVQKNTLNAAWGITESDLTATNEAANAAAQA